MYLTLRPPWGGGGRAPFDAGVVLVSPDGGAPDKPNPKRRPGRRAGTVAAPPGEGGDETEPIPLTDADRRLEWRGDEVALPTTKLDMRSGAEARPLEDSEINPVISSQTGDVRACVLQGATGTDLRATITIKMLVDGKGHVTKSRMEAPHYLFDHGLLSCAQRALGRMVFPPTHAPTLVTLPVNLG